MIGSGSACSTFLRAKFLDSGLVDLDPSSRVASFSSQHGDRHSNLLAHDLTCNGARLQDHGARCRRTSFVTNFLDTVRPRELELAGAGVPGSPWPVSGVSGVLRTRNRASGSRSSAEDARSWPGLRPGAPERVSEGRCTGHEVSTSLRDAHRRFLEARPAGRHRAASLRHGILAPPERRSAVTGTRNAFCARPDQPGSRVEPDLDPELVERLMRCASRVHARGASR